VTLEKTLHFCDPEEVFNKYFKKTNYKLGTCTKYFTYFSACLNNDKNTHKIFCDYCRELKKQCNKESKINNPIKIHINIQETPEYSEFIKSLYTNYGPLRSDYCTVKFKNYNKETDNYYENGVIYFNKLVKVPRNYIIEKKLNENGKLLDLRNVELLAAKMMQNIPVLILSFKAQQVEVIKNKKTGEIVDGSADKVNDVYYVWVITKDEIPNPLTKGWKLNEFAIQLVRESL